MCVGVASDLDDSLDSLKKLIRNNPDSAYVIGERLVEQALGRNEEYYLVKALFGMAYIKKQQGVYDKAVIHYLDAVRFAEGTSYKDVGLDLIKMRRNLAIIFGKFHAIELSEEYYQSAIDLCQDHDNRDLIPVLHYDLALLYKEHNLYSQALSTLEVAQTLIEPGSDYYFRSLSLFGTTLKNLEKYDSANYYFGIVLKECPSDWHRRKGFAYNNLGQNHEAEGDFDRAANAYLMAIREKKLIEKDSETLFNSFKNLGALYTKMGMLDSALFYLNKAESLIPKVTSNPESHTLYLKMIDLFREKGNQEMQITYHERYEQAQEAYLKLQADIKKEQDKYNMNLITKRYFDAVEAQEYERELKARLIWVICISVFIMILIFAGFKYKDYRLRKELEEELVALKIIE